MDPALDLFRLYAAVWLRAKKDGWRIVGRWKREEGDVAETWAGDCGGYECGNGCGGCGGDVGEVRGLTGVGDCKWGRRK